MGEMVHGYKREQAKDYYERSLMLYRDIGDSWGEANALRSLGEIESWHGKQIESASLFENSLEIFRRLGDPRGITIALESLSFPVMIVGRPEEGEALLHEAIAIRRDIGDRAGYANSLLRIGAYNYLPAGRFVEAESALNEALNIFVELGMHAPLIETTLDLAWVKLSLGDYKEIRSLAETGTQLSKSIDYKYGIACGFWILGVLELVQGDFAEAYCLSQECLMLNEHLPRYNISLSLAFLTVIEYKLNMHSQAIKHVHEALQIPFEDKDPGSIKLMLSAVALLKAKSGEVERAVEIHALAATFPWVTKGQFYLDIFGKPIAEASTHLPPEVIESAQERGRNLDPMETARELLAELEAQIAEEGG
jgi:tetratricopeptide (TPR) repeat protein